VANGPRDTQLRLEGSAYFDVPHDPARQLVIAAGPYAVRDIGTRFELMSDGRQLKVAVAEGQVNVSLPGTAQPVAVAANHRLLVAGDPTIAEYGQVEAAELASWREGRLVFRNEPLSMVASQVGRHAGLTVTVDPAIAQQRFSGVLAIGDGSRLVAELGQIMGLREVRDAAGVRLVAADDDGAGR
jgi:transmembrane sensor